MRKLLAIIFIISLPATSVAQYALDWGFGFGTSNYLGDIGGKTEKTHKFIKDMQWSKTALAAGGFVRYRVHSMVAIKGGLNFYRISGDDKLSTEAYGRQYRNLNFKNNILEFSVHGNVFLLDELVGFQFKDDIKAYLIAGFSIFNHNPYTTYNGQKINLRPLKTEGVSYGAMGFALPMGAGFSYTMQRKWRIGIELVYNKAFTDYLDDVSANYPDAATLNNDPIAIALSNRHPELEMEDPGLDAQYLPGEKRGDPTKKDTYMSLKVNASYVVRGKSSFYKAKFKGSIFKRGKKYKKRKFRAKF